MTLCIPRALGVPGLNNQPPTWPGIDAINGFTAWATGPPSVSIPRGLDDPRWQGTLKVGYPEIATGASSCCAALPPTPGTFGVSTEEDAVFRALYQDASGNKSLYLSWWVKADDAADHSEDLLYVGFERQAGDPVVIEIAPFNDNTPKLSQTAFSFTMHTAPNTGGDASETASWTENGGLTPSWIDANTRVWLDATNRWAVQMRVPIGAGSVDTELDLADTFKMWYEIRVELPSNNIVPYTWPRQVCTVDRCGFPSELHVPDPSVWEDFHLSTGAGDPQCPVDGFVTLDRYDVGTTNTPTSQINLVSPNTFEAKPENLTGAQIDPGEVSAEFRIADWGSVADPAAPWNLITATGGTSNPDTNPAAIANGAKGSITFEWDLNPAEQTDYGVGGTKASHQCILVTLGGGFVFAPASVWRNMDFVNASRFERAATISNVGLGPSPQPGDPRPAYILVEKLNMPAEVGQDDQPKDDPPRRDRRVAHGMVIPDGGASAEDEAALERAARETQTESDRLDDTNPTIRYHTYHETGVTVTHRNGEEYQVLRPGTAFGYFVEHEGSLLGWSDELQGDEVERITDNFYRLKVPEEGTVQVVTVVEAREEGGDRPGVGGDRPGPQPQGCLAIIAKLLRFLRRRSQG